MNYGEDWPPAGTTEPVLAEFSRQFPVDDVEAPPSGITTDSEIAESAGVYSVDGGNAWPLGLAESCRHPSVDLGEARPPGVTTESQLAESGGKFTVEIGEARPPKRAKYTVEQIVDMPGPQYTRI